MGGCALGEERRVGPGARRAVPWLLLGASIVTFGAAALWLGQDANPDLLNSHAYVIWATTHSQQDFAWAPGGIGSYLPAHWNYPWYWLALHAPARVAGFYLGALDGVAVWLAGALCWRLLGHLPVRRRAGLTGVAVAIGVLSPGLLVELGTTFGDVATGIPMLGAVHLLLSARRRHSSALGFLAQVLVGTSLGLKLSNAPLVLALCVSSALLAVGGIGLWRWLLTLVGVPVGFLVTDGWWLLRMERRFDNPLFPLFNDVFGSPYGAPHISDPRWSDNGGLGPLSMAWRMVSGSYPFEGTTRDARWLVVVVAVVVGGVLALRRHGSFLLSDGCVERTFLVAFVAVGYTAWSLVVPYSRYLSVLDLLSGVCLVVVIEALIPSSRWATAGLVVATAAVLVPLQITNVPRVPYGSTWFALRDGQTLGPNGVVVVLPSDDHLSFFAPMLPEGGRMVQVPYIWRTEPQVQPTSTRREDREVADLLTRTSAAVVSLTRPETVGAGIAAAPRYGYVADPSSCRTSGSSYGQITLCPWSRR